MAIPTEIRLAALFDLAGGMSLDDVAKKYSVSVPSIKRWRVRKRKMGFVEAMKTGRVGQRKIIDLDELRKQVEENPGIGAVAHKRLWNNAHDQKVSEFTIRPALLQVGWIPLYTGQRARNPDVYPSEQKIDVTVTKIRAVHLDELRKQVDENPKLGAADHTRLWNERYPELHVSDPTMRKNLLLVGWRSDPLRRQQKRDAYYSAATRQKALDALDSGVSVSEISSTLGVSRQTIHKWIRKRDSPKTPRGRPPKPIVKKVLRKKVDLPRGWVEVQADISQKPTPVHVRIGDEVEWSRQERPYVTHGKITKIEKNKIRVTVLLYNGTPVLYPQSVWITRKVLRVYPKESKQ